MAAAAAAARRALRYGVSPKAQPTRRHINSGRGLDISEPNGPLDRYIQTLIGNVEEIKRIQKILSKRDMVKQSSESLIFERKKKMGTHNMQCVWKVAGITSSACLLGTAFMTFFAEIRGGKHAEEKEDRILQDEKRLGLEE